MHLEGRKGWSQLERYSNESILFLQLNNLRRIKTRSFSDFSNGNRDVQENPTGQCW